jgi:hypothetical protein
MCKSGPSSEEKPFSAICPPVIVTVPATCLPLRPEKVPVRVLAEPATGDSDIAGECDIAGDCDIVEDSDIAGADCVSCLELQAVKAKAVARRTVPRRTMSRM